jgi:hypothetical protein
VQSTVKLCRQNRQLPQRWAQGYEAGGCRPRAARVVAACCAPEMGAIDQWLGLAGALR